MPESSELTVGQTVDWRFAATVGRRLARPAPPTTEYTRRQAIADLAGAAESAESLVREVTGLQTGGAVPQACIVDRSGWIAGAAESMRVMTGGAGRPRGLLAPRIAAIQTGAVLAFVASGILGQYDPFAGADGGVLLLVYPNVIAVERQLRVQPSDFRLWVCLHEVTHRVQFTANPWLSSYMSDALAVLTTDGGVDPAQMVGRLAEYVRGRRGAQSAADAPDAHASGVVGLLRAVQSEPQRQALDRLLVLGTLLEGHADHVMDAVGPAVVPSVTTIRRRFDDRRQRGQSPLQRLVRALLGIDAKISQYTRGKAFVDHVVGEVGMDRFNRIWSDAETLPLPAEIEDPQRWIERVL